MNSVFLLLGSNLGERGAYLAKAVDYIANEIAPVIRQSAVYETQSWGKKDAPNYLNQVIVIQTDLPPRVLLDSVLKIEAWMGRLRKEKWGARTIDIDILFYGDDIVKEEGLNVPHPELHKRRFTLEPLFELVPDMVHPVLNKKIKQLRDELNDNLTVKRINLKEREPND